jgi:UPF0755 protein
MRRRRSWFHAAIGSLVVVLLLVGGAAGWLAWWLEQPLPLATSSVELSIESGSSPREIAQGWVEAGVQASPELIYQWFRWSGQARRIRAGSYALVPGATPRSMLEMMVQGRETLLSVRLIEGWTLRQVRAALNSAPGLRPTTNSLSDESLMQVLGSAGVAAEGRFFPDTYTYSKGVSDLAVLRRAHKAMQVRLAAAWADRTADSPLKSAEEALILASIVEKETGRESDRGLVAGVFVNRLRIGMPLQTDPTVIYGLGPGFDGNLRKRDLLADTPYNTYTRNGLPPTPIALPGMASLRAVVQPQSTRALYFVARGDGSSQFSETLAEHNRAVNRFQRASGS